METMRCYFIENVDFAQIRDCLNESRYKAVMNDNPAFGSELIIHYRYGDDSAYMRWFMLEEGLSGLSNEQISRIKGLKTDFRAYYSIWYWFSTLTEMIPIFSLILGCFDGVFECEGSFFDKSNITELSHVKLPPLDYEDS